MVSKGIRRLRLMAACLIILSGFALIASLWFRDLSEVALLDAIAGACYLIAGIGLFGRSRFSLFIGAALPAISAFLVYKAMPEPDDIYRLRMAADIMTVLLCLFVFWCVRKEPSI